MEYSFFSERYFFPTVYQLDQLLNTELAVNVNLKIVTIVKWVDERFGRFILVFILFFFCPLTCPIMILRPSRRYSIRNQTIYRSFFSIMMIVRSFWNGQSNQKQRNKLLHHFTPSTIRYRFLSGFLYNLVPKKNNIIKSKWYNRLKYGCWFFL